MRSVLVCLVLFWTPLPASAEDYFSPVGTPNEEQVRAVTDAIMQGRKLSLLDLGQPQEVDTKDVWRGNAPVVKLSLERTVLHFFHGATKFTVELQESSDYIVVRHSRPASERYTGGARINFRPPSPLRYYLEGGKQENLVVWTAVSEQPDVRGVLFCPRNLAGPRFPGDRFHLNPYDMEFQGAQFYFEGEASGYLLGGLGAGKASLELRSTENIPSSLTPSDRAVTKDPRVSLTYSPEPLALGAGPLAMSGGLQAYFDMELPSGHRRESFYEQVGWVLPTKTERKVEFVARERKAILEPGPCWLLLRQFTQWHRYHSSASQD